MLSLPLMYKLAKGEVWKQRDPRVDNFPLLTGFFFPTFYVFLGYIVFTKIASKVMSYQTNPFDLRKIQLVHSCLQVVLNGYIVYRTLMAGWWNRYPWVCAPPYTYTYPKPDPDLDLIRCVWMFFLSRFPKLLDTFFLICHKEFADISFPHMLHRSTGILLGWALARFLPSGHCTFLLVIEGTSDVLMYLHDILRLLRPTRSILFSSLKPLLQLFTFKAIILHNVLAVLDPLCPYPAVVAAVVAAVMAMYWIAYAWAYFMMAVVTLTFGKRTTEAKKKD